MSSETVFKLGKYTVRETVPDPPKAEAAREADRPKIEPLWQSPERCDFDFTTYFLYFL